MYTLHSFKESQIDKLHSLIRQNSFGILTSYSQGKLQATHLPFMVEPGDNQQGTLVTHMARANKHWRSLDEDTGVAGHLPGASRLHFARLVRQ